MNEVLADIRRVAGKHPNARLSKLIHNVEEEPSQKSIVLLLMELAEHAEYATEFAISLRYYLELFERLGVGQELVLNEAGLLLVNSSKIYARRVDYVQGLVERQILTLSSADRELAEKKRKEETTPVIDKPKKGRKRVLDVPCDRYEVELAPKKFRKLSEEKRFAIVKATTRTKSSLQRRMETEQFIHPAGWVHAAIVDLENEEEIDSKRNYKLFTYHVEHRYNTLVSDINFRLHFKMKDYMDEEEELMEASTGIACNTENLWPPLSEAYVQKYLNLENHVLEQEISPPGRKRLRLHEVDEVESCSSGTSALKWNDGRHFVSDREVVQTTGNCTQNSSSPSPSEENGLALGNSFLDTTNVTNESTIEASALDGSPTSSMRDSGISSSLLEPSFADNESTIEHLSSTKTTTEDDSALGSSLLDNSKAAIPSTDGSLVNDSQEESGERNEMLRRSGSSVEDNSENESNRSDDGTKNVGAESVCPGKEDINQSQPNNDVPEKPPTKDDTKINLGEVRIHMPHLDDEGVFFSDLDELEQRMLSPTVIATDVFPCIPNKENLTIIVDDEIKALLNICDEEPETYTLPALRRPPTPAVVLNIFKFHEKLLKRRVLFKLGPDMDLFIQARSLKRSRTDRADALREHRQPKLLKWFPLNSTDLSDVCSSPPYSPGHCSDFYGFTEDEYEDGDEDDDDDDSNDFYGFSEEEQAIGKKHRLSRDSGVGVDVSAVCTPEKETVEAFAKEDNRNHVDAMAYSEQNVTPSQKQTEDGVQLNIENPKEASRETGTELNEASSDANVSKCNETSRVSGSEHKRSASDESNDNPIIFAPPNVDRNLNDTFLDLQPQSNKSKIQQWHEHLQPILAQSRERHHFDVFQIGTEIIEKVQSLARGSDGDGDGSSGITKTATLADVMNDRDRSYISRYFLSSLLLANQNNIKFTIENKGPEKPSAWSEVHLELLSTKRHRVAVEDNVGIIESNIKMSATSKSPALPQAHADREKLKLSNGKCNTTGGYSGNSSATIHGSNTATKNRMTAGRSSGDTNCHSPSTADEVERVPLESGALEVNLEFVKPLRPVEKAPRQSDDYDSGIFSTDELSS